MLLLIAKLRAYCGRAVKRGAVTRTARFLPRLCTATHVLAYQRPSYSFRKGYIKVGWDELCGDIA
eukprot:1390097-Amorphochlora_amoeboformis.AAC.1